MNHENEYNLGGVIDPKYAIYQSPIMLTVSWRPYFYFFFNSSFDYNSLNALPESHTEITRSFSNPRDSALYGALGKTPPNRSVKTIIIVIPQQILTVCVPCIFSPPPSISTILEEADTSSP